MVTVAMPDIETLEDFIVSAYQKHDLVPQRQTFIGLTDDGRRRCACPVGVAYIALGGLSGRSMTDELIRLTSITSYATWKGIIHGFDSYRWNPDWPDSPDYMAGYAIGQRVAARVFEETGAAA